MVAQHDAYIGKQIGNYRISRKLASGGFGSVYLAQHLILAERVAVIKLLHAIHLDSEQESAGFLREAQFLEKLKHPFILAILDVGIITENGQNVPYLIAEYAPNGSLRQRIESYPAKPFPLAQTTTILSQVGQALQHAHQQNIIHRDIKPENILFNGKDEALLADFGIATALQTASVKFTRVIGTPSYMAPEQFQGMVSRETDQYALACIAYELFTGFRPFAAPDTMAMMYKQINEYPPLPRQVNPQLPAHIEQAILKAMTKERTERFPSVGAFIDALQAPQAQYTPAPPPPTSTVPALPIAPPPPSAQFSYGLPPVQSSSYANNGPLYPSQPSQPSYPPQPSYGYPNQGQASYGYANQLQMAQVPGNNQQDIITAEAKKSAGWSYLAPFLISIPLVFVFPLVHLIYWLVARDQYTVKTNRFARFHFIQSMFLNLCTDIVVIAFIIFNAIVTNLQSYTNGELACKVNPLRARPAETLACTHYHTLSNIVGATAVVLILFLIFLFSQWLRGVIGGFSGKYMKLPFFGKRAEARLHKRPI